MNLKIKNCIIKLKNFKFRLIFSQTTNHQVKFQVSSSSFLHSFSRQFKTPTRKENFDNLKLPELTLNTHTHTHTFHHNAQYLKDIREQRARERRPFPRQNPSSSQAVEQDNQQQQQQQPQPISAGRASGFGPATTTELRFRKVFRAFFREGKPGAGRGGCGRRVRPRPTDATSKCRRVLRTS